MDLFPPELSSARSVKFWFPLILELVPFQFNSIQIGCMDKRYDSTNPLQPIWLYHKITYYS